MKQFFAHSGNGTLRDGPWETVAEHLHSVAETASSYAEAFGSGNQAQYAGLLHDLGKYSAQFQRRLSVKNEPSRDHWTLGAIAAISQQPTFGHFPALAIQGHHVGLQWLKTDKELRREWIKRMKDQP